MVMHTITSTPTATLTRELTGVNNGSMAAELTFRGLLRFPS
jgi:hypothetical protein